MKLIKQIQEDGMFGVAAKLENTIRNQREYKTLCRELRQKGITDYQIDMIRTAVVRQLFNTDGTSAPKYCLRDNYKPSEDFDHEIEAIKNLKRHGYLWTDRHKEHWWLTGKGMGVWKDLEYYNTTEATIPVVHSGSQNTAAQTQMINKQTDNLDVDLNRDGIVKTCSKLWWIWSNKELIEQRAKQKQLDEFTAGHATIEEAVQMIATSEQRVARKLLEQVPEKAPIYWTEAEQRKQNDIYWMSPNAFWLNPRGALAAPTPAPEWWVEPEDYRSMTARRLAAVTDDTVDLSLLPPPVDQVRARQDAVVAQIAAERKQLNADLGMMNLGQLSNEDLQTLLTIGNNEPTLHQKALAERYGYFARDNRSNLVYALRTNEEVIQWLKTFENIPHTIAGQGSISYGEMLRLYEQQQQKKSPEECIDELIAHLESLDGPDTDAYEQFVETIGSDGKVKRKRIVTGAPKKNQIVEQQNGFCLVEINNLVRGFETRLEAEVYLAEYHTDMMFRKAQEAERLRDSTYKYDEDTIIPVVYGKKGSSGPSKPSKSSK